jgi:ferredoxin-NADP reductase/predicted pyridoxine 5'-phosphate oxidase superfamily flavin-nucleotide-binding protein
MEPAVDRPSPWHAGELALQRKLGVADRMDGLGRRVVRDHLIEQHWAFYPLLPFVVLGAVEPNGDVWATLRGGREGFMQTSNAQRLEVRVPRDPTDPADRGMEDGDGIALLGIDLHTRRRNRLNGWIHRGGAEGFEIAVEQSFGNCNQYIQQRAFAFTRDPREFAPEPVLELETLDAHTCAMIARADTFFVASYIATEAGGRQVDVSHRGGRSGFVRVGEDDVLTIPDFAGNLFFNTLGNLLVNPKAGLVFPDFETGDLLQLTGDVELVLDSPEIAAFQGAERLWRFAPRRILYRPGALPLRWDFAADGWSPNTLLTGSWEEAAGRQAAAVFTKAWRPLRVAKIVDESSVIRSFHLAPVDGAGLVPHAAGQHLPIRITLPGAETPSYRTYTLSVAPSDETYRISVKREGLVSRHLHDQVREGDVIEARGPAGLFTIDAAEKRPAVMLAAGVGVTPLLAMLHHIVYEGRRTRRVRPAWLFHAARSKAQRAFDQEIAGLVEAAKGAVRVVRVLSDPDGAVEGSDYDMAGRIDMALLTATLPFNDYDFYLCGPPAFMQAIYDGLRGLNVADARIHAESFGPASLRRKPDGGGKAEVALPPSNDPVRVVFTQSGTEARWSPGAGSLLEFAEARGLTPEFSCREGTCGTCRTRIIEGAVAYPNLPSFQVEKGEALICCAVPADAQGSTVQILKLEL